MPKLSIIVPVYNVETYIKKCIESILSQTFKDFEVIIIDDGSPDNCGLIIDEYAQKDSRIVPIHQLNKGVSAARNEGLKVAKGEYIGFVDPDDWIEPEMYSILINSIESNHCDIASCSWMVNDSNGNETPHYIYLSSYVMTGDEYVNHLFDMPPSISGSTWNKLFAKRIIQSEFSKEFSICEDNLFVAKCCVNCKKAIIIKEPLYHVFERSDSATRMIPGRVVYGLPARKEIIEIVKKLDIECGMRAERVFLDQCIAYSKEDIEEHYRLFAREEFFDYMKKNSIAVIKNSSMPFKEKVMYFHQFFKFYWKKH